MTTFYNFEDMDAWKESRKLIHSISSICKREKVKRDFAFIDQTTRSSRSIAANIAEGSGALTTPLFIKYLGMAKSSAAEVRSHLYDALDQEYITKEEFNTLSEQTRYIERMIAKLIQYLLTTDQKRKRQVNKLRQTRN